MDLLRTVAEARSWRAQTPRPVGFVPTMGYLHEGHLSLIRRAREENPVVAVSIFVNPTQFGPNEDLARYPRDEHRDLSLLAEAGVDAVFVPPAEEMYGPAFSTWVDVTGPLTTRLEGAHRPGHFRGVATVVAKLFNILAPDRAYFGQKDAQQLAVVRRMAHDLNLPVEIVACPTVREHDGLAMSSRNVYLSPRERASAAALSEGLRDAHDLFLGGERSAEALKTAVLRRLEREHDVVVAYVSVADPDSFEELAEARHGALLLLAACVGATRLIDNIVL